MSIHRAKLTTFDNGHKPIINAWFGSPAIPTSYAVKALIDTGAEHSIAPRRLIDELGLEKRADIDMYGHGNLFLGKRGVFNGSILIRSDDRSKPNRIIDCPIVEGDSPNADIIIGMATLRLFKVTFFPGDEFTIEW